MASLLLFVLLQFCDALTTLVFLRQGVAEANPLIRLALGAAAPTLALLGTKALGCALAYFAWRSRRVRVLRGANCFFALCVAWNLVAISIAPGA